MRCRLQHCNDDDCKNIFCNDRSKRLSHTRQCMFWNPATSQTPRQATMILTTLDDASFQRVPAVPQGYMSTANIMKCSGLGEVQTTGLVQMEPSGVTQRCGFWCLLLKSCSWRPCSCGSIGGCVAFDGWYRSMLICLQSKEVKRNANRPTLILRHMAGQKLPSSQQASLQISLAPTMIKRDGCQRSQFHHSKPH